MSTNWLVDEKSGDLAAWVDNGRGQLDWVTGGGAIWPVTVGAADQGPDATWLTSLVSALIGTPREEAAQPHTYVGAAVRAGLGLAEKAAIASGVDTAVIVNNSLLSVSPLGPSHLAGLSAALTAAVARWPTRIVAARGIVAAPEAVRQCAAMASGVALPSRVSYAFDLTRGALPDKINATRDAAFLKKAGLDIVSHADFTDADIAEAHRQYLAVYIGRHGARNPRLTETFFRSVHRSRAAEFWGLRSAGNLAAFVALRDHGDFLSVPLIGYRTDADKKAGLYRQIFALALEVGQTRNAVVNFGAGAAQYKKLRGGSAAIEYMIIVPPRVTWLGRAVKSLLQASEEPLGRLVPKAIVHFGG